jgi:hypothetical protein
MCKESKKTAPNVPVVCDGLAARIRKYVAFPGPTNCAGAMAWEWSAAEWPSHTEPRGAVRPRSAYSPVIRSAQFTTYFYSIIL